MGFLDRLKRGLGLVEPAVGGAGNIPTAGIIAYFAVLSSHAAGLPREIARYAAIGDNSSVLATLQSQAVRDLWGRRVRSCPPRDTEALFTKLGDWRLDQMRRLGEICAAVEPISWDWGYFGTKKSPDWLRHVVTLWLGQGRTDQPIETLVALLDDDSDSLPLVLDIVFCRDAESYGSSTSVSRFGGVRAWLLSAHDGIAAAFPALAADVRAELAAAIGRFGLHHDYLDLLLDAATGSSKKARQTARQALTGADAARVAEALRARFEGGPASRQAEIIAIAASLGPAGAALLAQWRADASSPKTIVALDQAMSALGATVGSAETDRAPDGPRGYRAVDGTQVELALPDDLPADQPIDRALLRTLEPALDEFNRLLAAGKAEARQERHWHWSRQYSPKGPRDLDALGRIASEGGALDRKRIRTTVEWLSLPQLKHPSIAAFLNDPRLSLRHLFRLAAAFNGHLAWLLGDNSGLFGSALQARLANGADVRTVLRLWHEASDSDILTDHLARRWYWPLPDVGVPLWPVLCERFAQLDEALGMVPQTGAEPLRALPALELLAMFPKLPERYRARLMQLAGDTSARLREGARTLLRDTPGLGAAIATQLGDGKQEVRALAAEWLATRGERAQAGAIRTALKTERSDLARAAMITALGRLGEDVSTFFDPETLIAEAEKGLAKTSVKGLDWLPVDQLPALSWLDGAAVDPRLPRWWIVLAAKLKQPGGNSLIDLWLDRLKPGDAHRLGWTVLTGWIDEDTRSPTDAEANAFAAQHVDATLKQNLDLVRRYPQSADYWPTDRAILFAQLKRSKASTYLGSAADTKGVLALATRVAGADAAQRVRAFLKDHGARVSQAKALLELLAAIGDRAALQLLLSAANRSKQRSVQAHAAALVEAIADRNGWSAGQLADRTVPTGGFDRDGAQELECGTNRSYSLRLDATEGVVILNAEGREIKALPGPRTDEERPAVDAAKKQLSTARKEVKQVLAAQTERLQEAMCLQRQWEREEWETFVAGHPIIGRIACQLIWQGVDDDGVDVATFRPLGDGSYGDAADGEVALDGFTGVRLAHSSLLSAADIAAWRAHLGDYAVKPPFDQLGRDLPKLDAEQEAARTIGDREGWMIETFKLRGAAGKLGYQRGAAQDGGWFMTYEKTFREAGLLVEIEFTGSPLPEENRPAALHALSFRKIRAGTAGGGGQVLLREVPPVLLAECWRDLHDIADKGTGFDPDWQKKAGA